MCPRYHFTHITQCVPGKFGDVEPSCVVYVNRHGRHFEYIVFEPEDVLICPISQAAILGQAIAADSGAGEYHIIVSGPHFYGLNDLNQVNSVALRKQAPFIEKSKQRRPERVFDDFGCLRFDGSIHNRQREIFGIENFVQEFFDSGSCFFVAARTYPPEVPYRRDIMSAGHNAFEAVG